MSYSDSAAASASDSNENACNGAAEEVAIRIIEAGKQESDSSPSSLRGRGGELGGEEAVVGRSEILSYRWRMAEERVSLVSLDDGARDSSSSSSSSTYQRYDIQQVAKWIEHILSFSLLLLIVFICQHLQGIASLVLFCCLYNWFLHQMRSTCSTRWIGLDLYCIC